MKKIIFCGLFLSTLSYGQELDVRFLQTQRTASEPYNIPISISENGQVALGANDSTQMFSVNPAIQTSYRKSHIEYSSPVALNRFNLYPVQKDLGWIEVKRRRWELGAGLAALVKNTVTLGLVPYKGAMQTTIRNKSSQEEKLQTFAMPKTLNELSSWREGDSGTFQTYGGIQAYIGASAGLLNVATASAGIQNQFIVEMKKISPNTVSLSLTEENLVRRQLLFGPFFAFGTIADFDGKKFGIEFILDLDDSSHHDLFAEALKGNVALLQSTLAPSEQRLTWKGSDRAFYYGVPMVAGKTRIAGTYELFEDDHEAELTLSGEQNNGLLRRLKNYYQFIYQTDESLVIIWASEMNKVTKKEFDKTFFSKGKIMGVKGFNRSIPSDTAFGSVVSQIGLSFSKEETELLKNADLEEVQLTMKERCEKEELPCRKKKKLRKIISELRKSLAMPWKELRGNLGRLMSKEPALVYSVVRTLNLEKEVYFKFLSEKFQSMEGSEAIEI